MVSGQNEEVLSIIADVYGSVARRNLQDFVYKGGRGRQGDRNTQRDLNIALMNELAIMFGKLGIDTNEVLEAQVRNGIFAL